VSQANFKPQPLFYDEDRQGALRAGLVIAGLTLGNLVVDCPVCRLPQSAFMA
jgi:hypothetical protein